LAEHKPPATQSDKFKDAVRERGCDEDEARWAERLKRVSAHRPPTDDDIRDKFVALHELSKQVLRESGKSEAEIAARIASKGRKKRAPNPGKSEKPE
jgi:hypothetical protein